MINVIDIVAKNAYGPNKMTLEISDIEALRVIHNEMLAGTRTEKTLIRTHGIADGVLEFKA